MHEILLEGFSLCRWRSASLEALERSGASLQEKIKLGSTVTNCVSQDFLPILFPFPVKS